MKRDGRCTFILVQLFMFGIKKQGTGTVVWILLQITTFKDHHKHSISSLLNKMKNIPGESLGNTWPFFLSYKYIFFINLCFHIRSGIIPRN